MKIGILDIQGSVEEHAAMLKRLSVDVVFVKRAEDLEVVQGLILPGGESTTIQTVLHITGLDSAIRSKARNGMAIFGTCAGAIVLSQLGILDVNFERNSYGRQLNSFQTTILFNGTPFPAFFIRAPRVLQYGPHVDVLSSYCTEPVLLRERSLLVSMFHPELTLDPVVHRYFLSLCAYANYPPKKKSRVAAATCSS